jgi:arylsulfatase A-like enzyme
LNSRHSTPPRDPTGPVPATGGIGFACLLALALLLLSFVRLIGDINSAAFSFTIVQAALTDPLWHTRLGLNIALFFVALLTLHLGFGLACWLLAVASGKAFPALRCSRRQWIFIWFLAGTLWVLVANATRFPRSSLGEPYQALAAARILGASPSALVTVGLLAAITVTSAMTLYRQGACRQRSYLAAGIAVLAMAGFTWKYAADHVPVSSSPHVIFLGIDSLRPDFVTAEAAPHVRAFMDGAVQLTDAVTPLARTFPAWVSILSGRHPHTTGAVMNLLPRELVHTGATLPELLRRQGYATCYAIDETRFSNIDASYGFDRTATPAMGASDFVLAWLGDTPLSNLVVNTRLGAVLFPHLHANRAAHVIYDPDSFVRRVERSCRFSGPGFVAAHLTLPHWPFAWAASATANADESNTGELYREAVRRADQQFGDLLAMLERRGVLDNAIIVALSDHGEALGHAEDFMTAAFPGPDGASNNFQKWGHGTSVFSPAQYRVVLGIRAYGKARALLRQPAVLNQPVALVDLAPTILDLLQIRSPEPFDGVSLAPLLRAQTGAADGFGERIRFTETEYNPQGFSPARVETSMLALAAKVYRLDPATDRILVRTDYLDSILANRQYAALLGKRALAVAVPGENGYQFIYIPNTQAGVAQAADAARLRQALEERFSLRFAASGEAQSR